MKYTDKVAATIGGCASTLVVGVVKYIYPDFYEGVMTPEWQAAAQTMATLLFMIPASK